MGLRVPYFAILFLCVVYPGAAVEPSKSPSQCQPQFCGDQIVPYPFGLENSDARCVLDTSFLLTCNYTFTPPMLSFRYAPILNISVEDATATVQIPTAYSCYNEPANDYSYNLTESPFTFSSTQNTFVAIGCATRKHLYNLKKDRLPSCFPDTCDNSTSIKDPTQEVMPCSDIGCCHTQIPKGLKFLNITLERPTINHRNVYGSNPCDYAFLTRPNAKLMQGTEINSTISEVVLDWAVGDTTCEEPSICGPNAKCFNSNNGPGYICSCWQGYTGNPYTNGGCQGIPKTAGNGNINTAVSSATADTVQGSNIGYVVLLLLGFVKVWY